MSEATMDDPFAAPSTGDFFDWAAHFDKKTGKGDLLAMVVNEFKDHVPTIHTKAGEKSPAVEVDIYVLSNDFDDEGGMYEGTLVFSKTMVPQLKKRVGSIVLARLTQGEAKKGMNAPWVLEAVTPGTEDHKRGMTWYKEWKAKQDADPFAE